MILFMAEYTYVKWCKGRTYYDDVDKCYKHSGCKVSKEIAVDILNDILENILK